MASRQSPDRRQDCLHLPGLRGGKGYRHQPPRELRRPGGRRRRLSIPQAGIHPAPYRSDPGNRQTSHVRTGRDALRTEVPVNNQRQSVILRLQNQVPAVAGHGVPASGGGLRRQKPDVKSGLLQDHHPRRKDVTQHPGAHRSQAPHEAATGRDPAEIDPSTIGGPYGRSCREVAGIVAQRPGRSLEPSASARSHCRPRPDAHHFGVREMRS